MVRVFIWLFAMMIVPVSASAATLEPITKSLGYNGPWQSFRFDEDYLGGAWLDSAANPKVAPLREVHFTFSLEKKSTLQVVDGFRWGDRFDVYANGKKLGQTSEGAPLLAYDDDKFAPYKSNPDSFDYTASFYDGDHGYRWSRGEFHLDPGEYVISGRVSLQPEVRGRGALRLVDYTGNEHVVPLPGALPLMLGAGGMFVIAARRRASKKRD